MKTKMSVPVTHLETSAQKEGVKHEFMHVCLSKRVGKKTPVFDFLREEERKYSCFRKV